MWNRHRESEIHDIQEIGSGTKLYYLWVKGYLTWEERYTILLCWLLLHRQLSTQPTPSARSAQIFLASPRSECWFPRSDAGTQLSAFSQIPKILSPRFRCITSFTPSRPNWGLILTSVNNASFPRAREHQRSCLHLTNPCTEPKDSQPN